METSKTCGECHSESVAATSRISMETPEGAWGEVVSYLDAMHTLCRTCHEDRAKESPETLPADLGDCITCHDADRVMELRERIPRGKRGS